jgi:hypothetical protein
VLAGAAFVLLGVMEGALRVVPFRRLMPLVGMRIANESGSSLPPASSTGSAIVLPADTSNWTPVEQVAWGVEAAKRRTPWTSKCLSQSLTGAVLLRVRRSSATVYFGVRPARPAEGLPMTAHAWLVSDERIVTGAVGHEEHAVVAMYEGYLPWRGCTGFDVTQRCRSRHQ